MSQWPSFLLLIVAALSSLYSLITFVEFHSDRSIDDFVQAIDNRQDMDNDDENNRNVYCVGWTIDLGEKESMTDGRWCAVKIRKSIDCDRRCRPESGVNERILAYLKAIRNGAKMIYDGEPDQFARLLTESENRNFLTLESIDRRIDAGVIDAESIQNPIADRFRWKLFDDDYRSKSTVLRTLTINDHDWLGPTFQIDNRAFWNESQQSSVLSFYDSFWILIQSAMTSDPAMAIWSQRLLRESDQRLTIVSVRRSDTNRSNPTGNSQAGDRRRSIINASLFADEWHCPTGLTFDQCATFLARRMRQERHMSDEAARIIGVWIHRLIKVDYRFPSRKNSGIRSVGRPVDFRPPSAKLRSQSSTTYRRQSLRNLLDWCPSIDIDLPTDDPANVVRSSFERVVLVITFNHGHHRNIPILSSMYSPYFANVIFCSTFDDDDDDDNNSTKIFDHRFAFVHLTKEELNDGAFNYACLTPVTAARLPEIDGYLIIGDDVLLNFWNPIPIDRPSTHDGCQTLDENPSLWWLSEYGEVALRKLRAMLQYDRDRFPISPGLEQALRSVLMTPSWCGSDIFYIPSSKASDYYSLSRLFAKAGVFLEIAVPKIVVSLRHANSAVSGASDSPTLSGKYLWDERSRERPLDYFQSDMLFLHPFKLSKLALNDDQKSAFCRQYIRNIIDHFWNRN